nr:immunoglobulin light chain junction region [Macaca mulatta]
FMQAREFPLTF